MILKNFKNFFSLKLFKHFIQNKREMFCVFSNFESMHLNRRSFEHLIFEDAVTAFEQMIFK